jgi:hypothetical protein
MAVLTLGHADRAAGLGKTSFDPAELARAYPDRVRPGGTPTAKQTGRDGAAETAAAEIAGLRALVAELKDRVADLTAERDRLARAG